MVTGAGSGLSQFQVSLPYIYEPNVFVFVFREELNAILEAK